MKVYQKVLNEFLNKEGISYEDSILEFQEKK